MQKLRSFAINTANTDGSSDDLCGPLVSAHMVPDTSNCFMLEFHETQSIFIRNIKTGSR